jgi:uncharacterized phage protein (TIGR02220 family)
MSKHVIEGKKWIFNSYKDWQNQFQFWSESTIKRAIHSLEKQGCLISGNWNSTKMNKTKWYTIDYNHIEELETSQPEPSMTQDEPSITSEWTMDETKLDQAIPESTAEITTEKNAFVEIIDYLNETAFTSYKPTTRKTKQLIQARLSEGFTVEDFKKVIDPKVSRMDEPSADM